MHIYERPQLPDRQAGGRENRGVKMLKSWVVASASRLLAQKFFMSLARPQGHHPSPFVRAVGRRAAPLGASSRHLAGMSCA